MDKLQFTADVIKSIVSLAWPAAFVGAVWLFREKLIELMPLLRFKYKDLDVSFRLDQAERDAKQLPAPPEPTVQPTPEESSRFEQLARISPRAAILEMRSDLEEALQIPYRMADPKSAYRNASLQVMIRTLRKHNYIDEKTAGILDDLRAVGNRAAHGSSSDTFTEEDALRFRSLVQRLTVQFPGKGKEDVEPEGTK
ncbi:DUF4145 domain-containing protein [Bradyrhizobium sp. Pear77]|uniref:DUF4145 domain-containing protein n=1 Tax=Bradyrhizobium altum TaxID=1571202 RepID=UPI001E4CD4D7|nr:DUF4145 domain-containing protein [Bradyrhizobium altum]MCC8954397.1 DUF4145 domain-containing protein [Bradyrhizobium altum]